MGWWDKNWGFVVFPILIVGVIWIFIEASDNDAKKEAHVATLTHMDEFSEVATGTYGSISLREFNYKNKRCLWASFGRQAGLTCWNKE